ncbi:hypothetical protein SGLAM104S_06964 [Streptomyces glaucescens]
MGTAVHVPQTRDMIGEELSPSGAATRKGMRQPQSSICCSVRMLVRSTTSPEAPT